MYAPLWCVWLIAAAPHEAPSIFVEDAFGELSARLRQELPNADYTRDRTSADIAIALSADAHLSIVGRSGTVIVERTLSGSRDVVLRAAALLVVDAHKTWEPAPDLAPEVAPEVAPAPLPPAIAPAPLERALPWRFGVFVGAGVDARWSVSRPQLLYVAGPTLAYGDFEGTVALSLSGFGCCVVATEALRSDTPRAIAVFAGLRYRVWRPFDGAAFSVLAAGGFQHESVPVRAVAGTGFRAPGTLQQSPADGPIGRAGAAFCLDGFGAFAFELEAGAQFLRPVSVGLPDYPEYASVSGRSLSRTSIAPYLLASLRYAVF